jgi:hypothetical protein
MGYELGGWSPEEIDAQVKLMTDKPEEYKKQRDGVIKLKIQELRKKFVLGKQLIFTEEGKVQTLIDKKLADIKGFRELYVAALKRAEDALLKLGKHVSNTPIVPGITHGIVVDDMIAFFGEIAPLDDVPIKHDIFVTWGFAKPLLLFHIPVEPTNIKEPVAEVLGTVIPPDKIQKDETPKPSDPKLQVGYNEPPKKEGSEATTVATTQTKKEPTVIVPTAPITNVK